MCPARTTVIALAAWAASLVLFAADRRIETVKKFEAAKERQDLATARELIGPNPRVWFDMEERKGPGESWRLDSGDWGRWDRFFHRKVVYSNWKSSGDHVTAIGRETNDYYRLLDWDPKPLALTWWFDSSGKIVGFMFHAVRDAPSHSRMKEFEQWARKNRPAEMHYLMPKGSINPGKDRPERWRKLLIEWRKETGLPEIALPPPPTPRP